MKKETVWRVLVLLFLILGLKSFGSGNGDKLKGVIPYSVPKTTWNQDFGNHRAEITVSKASDAVYVSIPWRRRDLNPEQKGIIITDSNGNVVKNIFRININREFGSLVFQPTGGSGTYYVYYMPFKGSSNEGWFSGSYLKPEAAPKNSWIEKNQLSTGLSEDNKLEHASVVQIQSRTAFDSFYPMEVCATKSEVASLVDKSRTDFILFPEDRLYPIRMTKDLPLRWIQKPVTGTFDGVAQKNEYYAFQIGVFAAAKNLEDIKVTYQNAKYKVTCFNIDGVDPDGMPFTKKINVRKGEVQPLWFGVDLPENTPAGKYTFSVIVTPKNGKPQTVKVSLSIENRVIADRGDNEPWRHSRLRWLNSTLGIDDNPVSPYTALKVSGKSISSYLHNVNLLDNGFPEGMTGKGVEILNRPVQLVVETGSGVEKLTTKSFRFTKKRSGVVAWKALAVGQSLTISVDGAMEADGTLTYTADVKAIKDITVKDIRLELPLKKDVAQYFMGMGLKGQACPESYEWKWKGPQDSYWVGTVKAGVHCEMRGATYSGPLLNLYNPAPPTSWYNDNKGGFKIASDKSEVVSTTYSGERMLKAGESIPFQFALLLTPVKEINTADQFINRYYHNGKRPAPEMKDLATGIKIINVHHANPVNPYINYPFIAVDSMKTFINKWHKLGVKVKIYYTIRELTNQTPEIWALRSLGDEVLGNGRGGGYPWLQEHFVDSYEVAWFTPINGYQECDAAVVTSGKSRWYNFYIEGLKWLVKHQDIDGLYLDDVAFDRSMLKRMRKVMDAVKPGCILDLHSNTGFSRGPANQYTEFFPYINKLWFGESFNYNTMSPENWLVEVSGIPFGLMGDMLHGGGNPWRGMVYGMTVRYPWFTEGVNCDPRNIWKLWDSFGIKDAKMVGYWEASCPVKTSNPNVLATAYIKNGKTLISVASWDKVTANVKLQIDWKALGLDPSKVTMTAPAIPAFQDAHTFTPDDEITIEPTKGWLIEIDSK